MKTDKINKLLEALEKVSGENDSEFLKAMREKIERLKNQMPQGLHVGMTDDGRVFIGFPPQLLDCTVITTEGYTNGSPHLTLTLPSVELARWMITSLAKVCDELDEKLDKETSDEEEEVSEAKE